MGNGSGAGGTEGGQAGTSGDGGTGGAGPLCDTSKSPREETCIVDEGAAIFVSPDGKDTNSGRLDAPVKTIARALTLARNADKPVVACVGTYKENLSISGKAAARVYGGFDCDDWTVGDEFTVVAPDTGVPLTISNAEGEVVLEGVEVRAASATSPGASSIAAVVSKSADVTFRDSRLVAGNGMDGKSAEAVGFSFVPAKNGNDASGIDGGGEQTCACPAGDETIGGRGGNGDDDGMDPDTSEGGESGTPDHGAGKGGIVGQGCNPSGTGQDGNPAIQTAIGKGATTYGTWSNNVWTPSPGQAGLPGAAGQGGGGGRGGKSGGGGGGGCGGCGGKGGGGGSGGGASLALVSIDSTVVLEDSHLVLGKAGNGGKGAEGQEGQQEIGFGGDGATSACDGGAGGSGAPGAPGGGGAGGISVGILFQGDEPTRTGGTYIAGTPGEGGIGGSATSTVDDGKSGDAQKSLGLP